MMRAVGQWRATLLLLPLVVAIASASCDCGASAKEGSVGPSRVLSSSEAKRLLRQLPYRYRWRRVEIPEGASGALAGTVIGRHRTTVHFGISLGSEAEAVSVPLAGTVTPVYYPRGGFVFNDDLEVPGKNETVHPGKQFHTAAQWNEAGTMVVEMEEKLCKAATGEPCPP